MKKILEEHDGLLTKPCEIVTDFREANQIAQELIAVAKTKRKWWNRWLGYAANQIGYSKRIIVLRKGDGFEVMINPLISEKKLKFPYLEKCYSIEGLYLVSRFLSVRVRYQDLKGSKKEAVLKGLSAIYQEVDHINGILVSQVGLKLL